MQNRTRPLPPQPRAALALTVTLLLLSACGRSAPEAETPVDPAITAALADPLMIDPDLARQNRGGAVLTGTGVGSALIPTEDRGEETIAAARAEAARLLGSAASPAPPASGDGNVTAGETVALSAKAALGANGCIGKLQYGFIWAARMDEAFAVYPRGHVQDAAGADGEGCHLRTLSFRSPVVASDLVDFYYARAQKAGFSAEHRADGDAHALSGSKGAQRFAVYVRPGPDGLTAVDLVTSG